MKLQYLNQNTYRECFAICDKIEHKYIKRKTLNIHDYPAAVVSCINRRIEFDDIEVATSGKANCTSYDMVSTLKKELQKIGKIGRKGNLCKNYVGACAEPRAAKKVMMKNPDTEIDDLLFSFAYRPRTKCVIPYCKNCLATFNL